MSAVVRRWIRIFCGTCAERTVFELRSGSAFDAQSAFVCTKCHAEERRIGASGLLATA